MSCRTAGADFERRKSSAVVAETRTICGYSSGRDHISTQMSGWRCNIGRAGGAMHDVPPFHHTGDPDGHFFALAFSRGRYVSPSGATNKPAFLVLYFSTSADFAPFSYMTVSTEAEW